MDTVLIVVGVVVVIGLVTFSVKKKNNSVTTQVYLGTTSSTESDKDSSEEATKLIP